MHTLERYRHYKGALILKVGEARHSETEELMVIYIHADNGDVWVRPKTMFEEEVEVNGKRVRRFAPVEQADA